MRPRQPYICGINVKSSRCSLTFERATRNCRWSSVLLFGSYLVNANLKLKLVKTNNVLRASGLHNSVSHKSIYVGYREGKHKVLKHKSLMEDRAKCLNDVYGHSAR